MVRYFDPEHLFVLNDALSISEEVISDHYALSNGHWIRNPYEVRTLKELDSWEYPGGAYAQLVRYGRPLAEKQSGRDSLSFYRICLHDENILSQTLGGERKRLLPFLLYVMTHELVHITRFGLYDCHPLVDERNEEECVVHRVTHAILAPVAMPGLGAVLDKFLHHREPYATEEMIARQA